jgi:hypothetical protein
VTIRGIELAEKCPISDMASRGHALHAMSRLPRLGQRLLEAAMQLLLIAVGLAWLDPDTTVLAVVASLMARLASAVAKAPWRT